MKRGYTIGQYLEMLAMVREELPHAAVTSDFIVGFCGETDEEFRTTLDLVRSAGFKNSFIFKYSPRPGTKAFDRQADDVPEEVKRERHRVLLEAQADASLAGNRRFIGVRRPVLVEGLSAREEKREAAARRDAAEAAQSPAAQGGAHETVPGDDAAGPEEMVQLSGRTTCDRIVVFDGPRRLVGRIIDVEIRDAGAWSLDGVVADGLAHAVPLELDPVPDAESPPLYQIGPPARPVS
jgi:tRNA-2-methylthio-N6-dimethylallyladenosine synthase